MGFRNTLMVLALTLLTLTGCKSAKIPSNFEPLTELKERTFGDGTFVTTFHTSVWTNDIDSFLKRAPIGSHAFNAVMLHERIHSIRMGNFITTCLFGLRYAFDTEFMWEEERIGWYFELKYRQKHGILRPAEHTAITLAKYKNGMGRMISYDAALKWVYSVLTNNWKPSLSAAEWEHYAAPVEK